MCEEVVQDNCHPLVVSVDLRRVLWMWSTFVVVYDLEQKKMMRKTCCVFRVSWRETWRERWNDFFLSDTISGLSHACSVSTLCKTVQTKRELLHAFKYGVWEVYLFTPFVGCQGIESFQQAQNNYLKKRSVEIISATSYPVQILLKDFSTKNFHCSVQVENAKNLNFDSTSNRRAAPSARIKTNWLVWLKGKISIQFEDQLCSCSPWYL